MTENEAKQIFKETICGHWENWPRDAEEVFVWVKALTPLDCTIARDAINELYEGWKGERYPKMPMILAAIHKYARARHGRTEMAKLYQIEREDGTLVWRPFWGHASTLRQELEPEAERLCREADRMFPGRKHIICWFDPRRQEPQGYDGPDARDKAFDAILSGPDTKTRRWLEKYLSRKDKATRPTPRQEAIEAQKKEPVAIGQVIEDQIPF